MFKKLLILISKFGKFITDTIEQTYERFNKNATGQTIKSLRQAIKVDVEKGIELDTFGSKVFEYNENGRPAGAKMPPAGVLDDWMKARGIPLAKEFAIRMAIAKNGIAPTPIIETSFMEVQVEFTNNIAPKMVRALTQSILEAIKKGIEFPTN